MTNQTSEAVDLTEGHVSPKVARRSTSSELLKQWEKALKAAEQIRQQLADRTHSDSTELVTEDRQR